MAKANKDAGGNGGNGAEDIQRAESASVALSKRGVHSSQDFCDLMCTLMTDVVQGDVTPDVVNAACNAGRSLLRMVDLEYRAAAANANNRSFPLSRRIGEGATA